MNLIKVSKKAQEKALQVIKEMSEGKRSHGIEWGEDVASGRVTLKEMLGTQEGPEEFVTKITYDLYQGRENIPLLYKDIYNTKIDANFPKTLEAEEYGPVQTVFLEKLEGGEIKFGSLGPGFKKTVNFVTYGSGMEYSEDLIEYNQTWKVSEIGVSFGESYNKLLNHLHLSPIISASYTTTGGGLAAQKVAQEGTDTYGTDGTAQLIAFDTNIATTLRNALTVLPRGTMILANTADRYLLEDAIAGSMYADTSPSSVKQTLSPDRIVYYDGDTVEVGDKTYTYTGVTAGYCYLIVPKKQYTEYIKHELRVDSDNGDLSRLIVSQIVGRARRAVLAGISGKFGTVKVDLYA